MTKFLTLPALALALSASVFIAGARADDATNATKPAMASDAMKPATDAMKPANAMKPDAMSTQAMKPATDAMKPAGAMKPANDAMKPADTAAQ